MNLLIGTDNDDDGVVVSTATLFIHVSNMKKKESGNQSMKMMIMSGWERLGLGRQASSSLVFMNRIRLINTVRRERSKTRSTKE